MEYVITNIGYFLELWMIQIYAELIWKQKICFRGFSLALFAINGIILTGVNLELVPDFFVLFVHILLFIYLRVRYKGTMKENIVKFCVVFVCAWGTEILSGIIVAYVAAGIKWEVLKLLLLNGIALGLSFCFAKIYKKRDKRSNGEIDYKSLISTIIICIFPILILVLGYAFNHRLKIWYNTFVVVLWIIVILYIDKVQKIQYEMKRKEMELSINRVYGGLYEDVINDIRRKQHNYKEQIAAIYSSHKTAQSLEELVKRQKEYCDMLLEDSKYDFILTSCSEPILAGFVYYKCLDGLSRNVKVDCKIRVNQWNNKIKLYEMIEVLGILFNNAFEYVIGNDAVGKSVSFTFIETEEFYNVSIGNEIDANSKIAFTKIFEMGYSTKGEGRGLGLPRAKQICNRYGLEIKVGIERNEKTRINFEIDVLK